MIPLLSPGEWYEIPNSKIQAVQPSPLPPGSTGPTSICTAWNGAIYDTIRHRYVILLAGGHGDYAGNEVYSLDPDNPPWQRIWGPTPNASIPGVQTPQAGQEVYLNGDPASRHTYSGVQYLPNIDRYFAHGGSLWGGSGGMGKGTWLFDPTTKTWQQKADIASNAAVPFSVYDPSNGLIYVHRYNQLLSWNPITNAVATVGGDPAGTSPNCTSAFDTVRRRMFLIGGGTTKIYDLAGPKQNVPGVCSNCFLLQTIGTSGDKTAQNASYPGVGYDPTTDTIVGWAGGGAVYELSPSFVWTKRDASNAVIPPGPTSSGTHGRWRHIGNGRFIVVSGIGQNAFIYQHGASSGGPAISAPIGLGVSLT